MGGAPDGFMALVPGDWTVPDAAEVPTTKNKDNRDGRLEPVPCNVTDLLKAGPEPPGALFRAEGSNAAGARLGVVVGAYAIEHPDPLAAVREGVAETSPFAELTTIGVARQSGLLINFPTDGPSRGERVVREYWAPSPSGEGAVALIRFWRDGPPGPDEEDIYDNVAGSAMFMTSGITGVDSGMLRRRFGLPSDDEAPRKGRWRYAGWRLGTVFHTGLVPVKEQEYLSELGFNQQHGFALLGVFVAWLVVALATIGWNTGIFLAGGLSFASGVTMLRKGGHAGRGRDRHPAGRPPGGRRCLHGLTTPATMANT